MLRLIIALLLIGTHAVAQDRVVLTIQNIADGQDPVSYTLADLDAYTQVEIKTTNEFVDGLTAFTGPMAREILSEVSADATDSIRFVAINEYQIDIAAEELFEYDVILATRMDNEVLPRRTKGPIWLMYPTADHPELQDARINAKLIWQVNRIEVR